MSESAEVSLPVAAPAEHVWSLVSDLPSMGRWSPECVGARWLGGAAAVAPGVRFRGHNRNGWRHWWTTGRVVEAEPGRTLSFDVTSLGLPVARWTYDITSDGAGCVVTERWRDHRGVLLRTFSGLATGVSDRHPHNTDGMRATLERLKAVAEAG